MGIRGPLNGKKKIGQVPRVETLPKPSWVPRGPAADLWGLAIRHLGDAGKLTEADGPGLGMLCNHFAIWMKAQKALLEQGPTVKGKGGFRKSPALAATSQAARDFLAIASAYGLTTLARQRLGWDAEDKDENDDDFDRFIRG